MIFPMILSAIDGHTSRVDSHTMSDQTMMELMIGDLKEDTKQRFRDEDGEYLPIEQWRQVRTDD